jgi:hypothetical protein
VEVAGAQVIRRLNFTWRGTPATTIGASAQAFHIVLYVTVFHWIMFAVLYVASFILDPNDYTKDEPEEGWIEPTGLMWDIIVVCFSSLSMNLSGRSCAAQRFARTGELTVSFRCFYS